MHYLLKSLRTCPGRIRAHIGSWGAPQWTMLALLAAIIGLYWVFAAIHPGDKASHAFRLLGEGFLSGHTHLSRAPDPRLAELDDPYDPSANSKYRVQDFTYYNGKYYLYFGPVPALVLWIPIKLLTGIPVTDGVLMLIFATIGSCALSLLVYLMASHRQPVSPPGLIFAVGALTFGTWIPFTMGEPYFYEAAIAGAYCFSSLGALSLWRFLMTSRLRWLALASLCLGLSVGCRVTHIFNFALLALTFLYLVHSRRLRPAIPTLLCLFAPWVLCYAGLSVYNYVRFGSPFEIGAKYMLTILGNMNDSSFVVMETRNFFSRLYYYLFHPLPWKDSFTFPFFEPSLYQPPWRQNTLYAWYLEPLYGLFTNNPFALFFPLFLCDWKAMRSLPAAVRLVLASLTLYCCAIFMFLLFYFFISARYAVDFAPWMVAIGSVYYLHLLQISKNPATYRMLLIAGGLLAAYGVFTGTMAGYCSYTRCTNDL